MNSEKMVAVAQDVLARLKAGKVNLERGEYITGTVRLEEGKTDLQDYVDTLSCKTCALGACLLSKARLYDDCPVTVLGKSFDGFIGIWTSQRIITEQLCDIFGIDQLRLIEAAFEGKLCYCKPGDDDKGVEAVMFGARYSSPYAIVVAIMENIVEHGEFKP